LPAQASTLEEAFAHYTTDAAFAEFAEDRKGRIAPGFLADLVVLSADVEATPPEALAEIRPAATVCGGRVVWTA
jgi:predicted amidohydrolase YtcJ